MASLPTAIGDEIIGRMSDAVRDALLDALLSCIVSLELSDDDLLDPGAVTAIQEDVAFALGRLGDSDRALLVTLIEERAAVETDPARRELLDDLPDVLGLLD